MSCACASETRHRLKLMQIIKHDDETYSFDFDKKEVEQWKDGDSSKVFLEINGQPWGKKFSYASLPCEPYVRFTTRIKSDKSEYKAHLSQMKIGDSLEVSTPSGEFYLRRENRPVVLLSNGVGIAAVRSLIKSFEKDDEGVPLLLQVNVDSKSTLYKEEMDGLLRKLPTFNSFYVNKREAYYPLLQEIARELLEGDSNRPYFYIVGSDTFVDESVKYLMRNGYTEEDIVTDGRSIDGSSSGCGCSSGGSCGCSSKKSVQLITKMM